MNTFKGRSFTVIDDFSFDEKMYLFQKAKELKEYIKADDKAGMDKFRINDPDFGIYEVFIEDSTRTKESPPGQALKPGYIPFFHKQAGELCRHIQHPVRLL